MEEEYVIRRIQGTSVCFRATGDQWEGVLPTPAAEQPSFTISIDGSSYRARITSCMLLQTADPPHRADDRPTLEGTDEIVDYVHAFPTTLPEAMSLQSAWSAMHRAVLDLADHMCRTFRPLLGRVPYEFGHEMRAMFEVSMNLLMRVDQQPPGIDAALRNILLLFKATAHAMGLSIRGATTPESTPEFFRMPAYKASVANKVFQDVLDARCGSRFCWSRARGYAAAGLDRYFERCAPKSDPDGSADSDSD